MAKWLILLLVVLVVVGVAGASKRRLQRRSSQPLPGPTVMLACAHCGVHVPEADAVMGDGHAYCSEAHRQLGRRAS